MKINKDDIRKKIIYRASYRGTKEMDVLISSFVNKIINDLSDDELLMLEKFVNLDSQVDFIGKDALKKIKSEGIKKKLMGVKIDAKEINVTGSMNLYNDKKKIIGELRSGVFNSNFKQVI